MWPGPVAAFAMKILVANLGSTSLKYRLFEFRENDHVELHRGGTERVTDYVGAIDACLRDLHETGSIRHERDLDAVAFKTILARDRSGCAFVDDELLAAMEACNRIAPAHNPPYVKGIRIFTHRMPKTPMVALFETAFYQWLPEAACRYAVPESWYALGVRRFGYHGASHKFIAERSADLLQRPDIGDRVRSLYDRPQPAPTDSGRPELRVISCHLGGSSSVTGLRNGIPIGNSFGTSPQSGLPQNNRSGDLDPFALLHAMREQSLSVDDAERLLSRESGLRALSGGDNDLRDIRQKALAGDGKAQTAIDVFVSQIRHWIGAFFFELDGIDALVFTAGIGENHPWLREQVCAGLERLGLLIDPIANHTAMATEALVSAPESRVQIRVIPTNEELVVAREARRMLQALNTANPI